MQKRYSLYNVMTDKKPKVLANFRIEEDALIDLYTVAVMRGISYTAILQQLIREAVRKDKRDNLEEFEKARLEAVEKRIAEKAKWDGKRKHKPVKAVATKARRQRNILPSPTQADLRDLEEQMKRGLRDKQSRDGTE